MKSTGFRSPTAAFVAVTLTLTFAAGGCGSPERTEGQASADVVPPPELVPSIVIRHIRLMQPGWVRVVAQYANAPPTATATLGLVGGGSAYGTALEPIEPKYDRDTRIVIFDLKAASSFYHLNSSTGPYSAWLTLVRLYVDGVNVAQAASTATIELGLPVSMWAPGRLDPTAWSSSPRTLTVPGPDHPYAAYPALQYAVKRGAYFVGFLEVEEDRARGTLKLRQLATFDGPSIVHELGGGAEIANQWGVNLTGRGVVRIASAAVETSHPGFGSFATGGTQWNDSFMSAPLSIHHVFRAPPIAAESTYLAEVLDNRGIAREFDASDQPDVVYFAQSHTLIPNVGVTLQSLSGPAPEPWDSSITSYVAPAGLTGATPTVAYYLSGGTLTLHDEAPADLPPVSGQVPPPWSSPFASAQVSHLNRSFAKPPPPPPSFDRMRTAPSPDELALPFDPTIHLVGDGVASCSLEGDASAFAKPVTTCDGFSTPSSCPTIADPVRVETLPAAPGFTNRVGLHDVLTPFLADRFNRWGTCSLHADVQHREAVLNRFADDLAPHRFAIVDGAAIAIPEARTAYSVAGYHSYLSTAVGTRRDDDDGGPGGGAPIEVATTYPLVPDAYWPAREITALDWASRVGLPSRGLCQTVGVEGMPGWFAGYWRSGFCAGQGTPPIGAYRTYSEQRRTHDLALDPVADGESGLDRAYQKMEFERLDFSDRDAAVRRVMDELRHGVPVKFTFPTYLKPNPGVVELPYAGDMTWYLPPELATCEFARFYTPTNGHALNIVGFWLAGDPKAPDQYRSIFILQNNWGATAGANGYFAINFAAFKAFGWSIERMRIAGTCSSPACRNP